jgi:hypothetical protein
VDSEGIELSLPEDISRKARPMTDEPVTVLSDSESWDLLGTAALGGLVTSFAGEPEIFPVNYLVQNRTILFRTAEAANCSQPSRIAP